MKTSILQKMLGFKIESQDEIMTISVNKKRFYNYLKERTPHCKREIFLSNGYPTKVVYHDLTLDGLKTVETLLENQELKEMFADMTGWELVFVQLKKVGEAFLYFDIILSDFDIILSE